MADKNPAEALADGMMAALGYLRAERNPVVLCADEDHDPTPAAARLADAKTEKTVAEELKQAAKTLRQVADGTTAGRWESGDLEEQPDYSRRIEVTADDGPVAEINVSVEAAIWPHMCAGAEADAAWIALANPLLAGPLASLLEEIARQYDAPPCDDPSGVCNGCERREDFNDALAVARVLNATSESRGVR